MKFVHEHIPRIENVKPVRLDLFFILNCMYCKPMTLNNRSKDQMLLYQCYINAYISLEWIKMSALSIQSCW